jgi:CspA family cold shock protein
MVMSNGVIRLLDGERGFGFVSSDSGRDIFFHYSELQGVNFQTLKEGQSVSYKVGLGDKGLIAKEIKLCEPSA